VRILACSDLHRDRRCARALVQRAAHADIVAVVGDLASVQRGLEDMIRELRTIDRRVLLVPGNNETDDALRRACAGWPSAAVLHGEETVVGGVTFFGLGGGIPQTPWDWSCDLSEEEAERRLTGLPVGALLLVHSPPKGHVAPR
jgi:Icc-related predicted phosphoesterase